MGTTGSRECDRPVNLQTLLGFDFGLQRIGVAVGQDVTGTATALGTLKSRDGQPDWKKISELMQTWRPDALVVGLPRQADGTDSDITDSVRRFIRQLEGRYRLPVHTVDERLSSHAAQEQLNTRDDPEAARGIDAVAARIILQDWLGTGNRTE
ncbi:MAG: Holliday junction resolvase RuvX [Gammaproteobacteria bacterium]|nr:MAG: Holliday junction resolvase RuvX [Gammaproteobacteria bacterium]